MEVLEFNNLLEQIITSRNKQREALKKLLDISLRDVKIDTINEEYIQLIKEYNDIIKEIEVSYKNDYKNVVSAKDCIKIQELNLKLRKFNNQIIKTYSTEQKNALNKKETKQIEKERIKELIDSKQEEISDLIKIHDKLIEKLQDIDSIRRTLAMKTDKLQRARIDVNNAQNEVGSSHKEINEINKKVKEDGLRNYEDYKKEINYQRSIDSLLTEKINTKLELDTLLESEIKDAENRNRSNTLNNRQKLNQTRQQIGSCRMRISSLDKQIVQLNEQAIQRFKEENLYKEYEKKISHHKKFLDDLELYKQSVEQIEKQIEEISNSLKEKILEVNPFLEELGYKFLDISSESNNQQEILISQSTLYSLEEQYENYNHIPKYIQLRQEQDELETQCSKITNEYNQIFEQWNTFQQINKQISYHNSNIKTLETFKNEYEDIQKQIILYIEQRVIKFSSDIQQQNNLKSKLIKVFNAQPNEEIVVEQRAINKNIFFLRELSRYSILICETNEVLRYYTRYKVDFVDNSSKLEKMVKQILVDLCDNNRISFQSGKQSQEASLLINNKTFMQHQNDLEKQKNEICNELISKFRTEVEQNLILEGRFLSGKLEVTNNQQEIKQRIVTEYRDIIDQYNKIQKQGNVNEQLEQLSLIKERLDERISLRLEDGLILLIRTLQILKFIIALAEMLKRMTRPDKSLIYLELNNMGLNCKDNSP